MDQSSNSYHGLSLKQRISDRAGRVLRGRRHLRLRALEARERFPAALHLDGPGRRRRRGAEAAAKPASNTAFRKTARTVLVPSRKLAESRLALAAAGLAQNRPHRLRAFDKSNFGATEFVEHINYKRALEGELERSVMSLAEVEQARVHLTLPKESVFLDQQQPAKASVMVKLRPGAQISAAERARRHQPGGQRRGRADARLRLGGGYGRQPAEPPQQTGPPTMAREITSESLEVRQQLEKRPGRQDQRHPGAAARAPERFAPAPRWIATSPAANSRKRRSTPRTP